MKTLSIYASTYNINAKYFLKNGDDAKKYQEKAVEAVIEESKK